MTLRYLNVYVYQRPNYVLADETILGNDQILYVCEDMREDKSVLVQVKKKGGEGFNA